MAQLGVVLAVHVPDTNVPLPHTVKHVLQAVCAPAVGWYCPAGHVTHCGVVVALHSPIINDPAEHVVVQGLHAADDTVS